MIKKFRALGMKHALDVYLLIYGGCKVEYYVTFNEILDKLSIKRPSLRRITNTLVRAGLIKSTKNPSSTDKRSRVYIVSDGKFAELLLDMSNPS